MKGLNNLDNNINYINSLDVRFSLNDGGLLTLEFRGEPVGRVAVLRMFPLNYEEEYLCVRAENYRREDKKKEIGIIRRLSDLPEEQAELLRAELKKRYFVPDITEVRSVKEEPGHMSWQVVTTAGECEFTISDMSSNIRNLGNNRILLMDVYGNRYSVPDVTKLDDKALKSIEVWI